MKLAFLHFWTLRLRRGVETMIISLANELGKQGVETSILTARQTVHPLVQPSRSVHVYQFPTFRYFESSTIVPFYVANILRQRYDVVVTFFADFGEGFALNTVRYFLPVKHVLYLTFPYEAAPHRYHAYQRWHWGKTADRLLADASYTAGRGEEFLHRPVINLPSGTDPDRFKPDISKRASMRERLGFRDEEIVLLNVSALEERKGTWRVIEALPQIIKHIPKMRYLILGEGPHKQFLQNQVNELNLDQHVLFAGSTSDLVPFYNAADIFVMLSEGEAGSVALLEAMASGLPVVVSQAGGFSEVVNSNNGYVVDMFDTNTLCEVIVNLAQDYHLRLRLGNDGRQKVIAHYSWENIAARLVRLVKDEGMAV